MNTSRGNHSWHLMWAFAGGSYKFSPRKFTYFEEWAYFLVMLDE